MDTRLGWRASTRGLVILLVVAGATVVLPAAGDAEPAGPGPDPGPRVTKVHAVGPRYAKQAAPPPEFRPNATALPAPGMATLTLDGTGRAGAAGSPVWARRTAGGPNRVRAQVYDRATTERAGVSGVLLSIDPQTTGDGTVQVGLDYAGFAQAYGGNYASRLRLVRLPGCALYTPDRPECRAATPLASTNDPAAQAVSAAVTFTAPARPGRGSAEAVTAATAPMVVLAATAGAGQEGGAAGTYAATDLKASGSWSAGGNAGDFGYSYPIEVPAAPSGLVPKLALSYSSSAIDGQTSFTQAQAGWAGDGWSVGGSFIEQTFQACTDSPEGSVVPGATADLCYAGPLLTLSLNGASSALVWDAGASTWRPQHEDGTVVRHVTDQNNGSGTHDNDWWTVTTRDGTVYSFGRNHLPGWTANKTATSSVDSQPVFSGHAGDPCYSPSGFAASVCTMAYRWNLDYVTDVHGNAMAYYYHQDTNYYGQRYGASYVPYVRNSYVDHIDYGFRDGNAYGTVPDKVLFGTDVRCTNEPCTPLNATTRANWPDVPYDLLCAQGAACASPSPSFFSTVRLSTITTRQWSVAVNDYKDVDAYALQHSLPGNGDNTSPTLFLTSIARTGKDLSAGGSTVPITLPAVTFTPTALANRTDARNFPALYRNRIGTITTETGSIITPTYSLADPCAVPVTVSPATNTSSCYPVYWTPDVAPAPQLDWFNKYVVTRITQDDPTGGAPTSVTSYQFLGGAAWHYDTNELVQAQYRTYGQFRGYGDVKTFVGDGVNDRQTQSQATYYRGMSRNNSTVAVTLTDSQGGTHDDADLLAGNPLEVTDSLGNGGPVDHSTITSYWVSPATATRTRTGLPDLTANWVRPAERFARQAITGSGATTWQYTEVNTTYDTTAGSATYGSVIWEYSHTVPAVAAYDQCTHTTYAPPNTAANLVALPSEVEVDTVACGGFTEGTHPSAPSGLNTLTAPAAVSRPAQVVSAARTYYDDPGFDITFPQTVAPSKGDPTMVRTASDYSGGQFTYQTGRRTTYDALGRVSSAVDPRGNTTTTAYTADAVGLTVGVTTTNALHQSSSVTYAPTRALTMVSTDPNTVFITRRYDALGRATAVWLASRSPASTSANYKYTYQIANTGPNGRVAVTTEQLNSAAHYVPSTVIYDGLFRVRQKQSASPNGGRLVSDTFYDSRGWTRAAYTGWSNPGAAPDTTLIAPDQVNPPPAIPVQNFYTYDGLGRVVVDASAANNVTVSTTTTLYNGNRIVVVPPLGGTTTAARTDPVGRTVELDDYSTAPTLNTPADTFTGIWSISGGTAVATTFGFDGHGNQVSVTDADHTSWTSAYNLLGQVTDRTDPDAGSSSYHYDAAGNLSEVTDGRQKVTSFKYDELNRKVGAYNAPAASQGPANAAAVWVYDNSDNAVPTMRYPIGHLTSSTAYWSGGQAYKVQYKGFNVFGASTGETVTIPGGTGGEGALGMMYTFGHAYQPLTGLKSSDTYPGAGGLPTETVNYGYTSAIDRPDTVGGLSQYEAGTAYDDWGRVSQGTLNAVPNVVQSQYDAHTGALKSQTVKHVGGSPVDVDRQEYQYDQAGRLLRQTSTRLGASTPTETQCYRYDGQSRLTAAWTATDDCTATPSTADHHTVGDGLAGSAFWTSWTIDALGNRTQQVQHGTTAGVSDATTDYTYNGADAGQPHTLTGTQTGTQTTAYRYDTGGNMISRTTPGTGPQTLTWNDQGQLVSVIAGGGSSTFKYDAGGNLLIQHDVGTTTLYLPGEQLVMNNTTGVVTGTRYYPLPCGAVAIRTGSAATAFTYQVSDQHGTPALYLDNTTQNPSWRQSMPYGEPRGAAGVRPDNHGFLGGPTDADTGLTRLGARNYDPAVARFLSVDPLFDPGDSQQLNGYSYAHNAPPNASDPSGQRSCSGPDDCAGDPNHGNTSFGNGSSEESSYHDQPGKTQRCGGSCHRKSPIVMRPIDICDKEPLTPGCYSQIAGTKAAFGVCYLDSTVAMGFACVQGADPTTKTTAQCWVAGATNHCWWDQEPAWSPALAVSPGALDDAWNSYLIQRAQWEQIIGIRTDIYAGSPEDCVKGHLYCPGLPEFNGRTASRVSWAHADECWNRNICPKGAPGWNAGVSVCWGGGCVSLSVTDDGIYWGISGPGSAGVSFQAGIANTPTSNTGDWSGQACVQYFVGGCYQVGSTNDGHAYSGVGVTVGIGGGVSVTGQYQRKITL
ncbi:RHS repeat-associated core domain-containing protein [Dactylosporangium vinaceum]|uniref:RHS repeat-associated core domain-containing protein n=1 Tax=Dactylosporangium vinaceum TaxID=53362 RepID=A0ABV5M3G8_9ACTN|nr:RHS repeat-associated core domain-containing protein [Dactylosporangium vinaceum]UAB99683.1 RHS repeat-associated core domain-containing protein [Dactylosporangium vinaceum]